MNGQTKFSQFGDHTNFFEADFGSVEGQPITLYCMKNDSGCEVTVFNYGATVQKLIVPDREGKRRDVVLGFDSLESYLNRDLNPYFGCVVGRCANRIDNGRIQIGSEVFQISINDPEHQNTLHGGLMGFDQKVWKLCRFDERNVDYILGFAYTSPDGEEGFPGKLEARVDYILRKHENALIIKFHATCEKDTICNLTNHSYFNLEGEGTIMDHELTTWADAYLPMSIKMLPTGEIRSLIGTPFDFRQKRRIGLSIDETTDEQIVLARGYDHSFHLPPRQNQLSHFWRAEAPHSGIVLDVFTDQVACHLYTGNWIPKSIGKNDIPYGERSGFALETQNHPNAMNMKGFQPGILQRGEEYNRTTEFKFSTN